MIIKRICRESYIDIVWICFFFVEGHYPSVSQTIIILYHIRKYKLRDIIYNIINISIYINKFCYNLL